MFYRLACAYLLCTYCFFGFVFAQFADDSEFINPIHIGYLSSPLVCDEGELHIGSCIEESGTCTVYDGIEEQESVKSIFFSFIVLQANTIIFESIFGFLLLFLGFLFYRDYKRSLYRVNSIIDLFIIFGLFFLFLLLCYYTYFLKDGFLAKKYSYMGFEYNFDSVENSQYIVQNNNKGIYKKKGSDVYFTLSPEKCRYEVWSDDVGSHTSKYLLAGEYLILGADSGSFKDLGYGYALDKNSVYYGGIFIKGADPKTFYIDASLGTYPSQVKGKDKKSVYDRGLYIKKNDLHAVDILYESGWGNLGMFKNETGVYYNRHLGTNNGVAYNVKLENADPKTISLTPKRAKYGLPMLKDHDSVFYWYRELGTNEMWFTSLDALNTNDAQRKCLGEYCDQLYVDGKLYNYSQYSKNLELVE